MCIQQHSITHSKFPFKNYTLLNTQQAQIKAYLDHNHRLINTCIAYHLNIIKYFICFAGTCTYTNYKNVKARKGGYWLLLSVDCWQMNCWSNTHLLLQTHTHYMYMCTCTTRCLVHDDFILLTESWLVDWYIMCC